MYFEALSKKYHFSLTTPWEELTEEVKDIILYGTGGREAGAALRPAPGQGRAAPAL
jgi:excinuclease ABC subunit A